MRHRENVPLGPTTNQTHSVLTDHQYCDLIIDYQKAQSSVLEQQITSGIPEADRVISL